MKKKNKKQKTEEKELLKLRDLNNNFQAYTNSIIFNNEKTSCKAPGQTIATYQHNTSQHCWVQHVACVWPPCCDVSQHVGCCWLKFETGQI